MLPDHENAHDEHESDLSHVLKSDQHALELESQNLERFWDDIEINFT